jgi:uncharacterized protein (DUF1800 family)
MLRHALLALAACQLLLACSTPAPRDRTLAGTDAGSAVRAVAGGLQREDVLWLQRVGYGLDSRSITEYRRLGRKGYLEQQLSAREPVLPDAIRMQIEAMPSLHVDAGQALVQLRARRRQIDAMADGPEREQARKSLNEEGNRAGYEAIRRQLLLAVYSPQQLQEQMVWFWLNHFSVHQYKADLRWLVGDYAQQAIRPHALGHFRDLVLATLEHPAMLQYLDNQQNAAGHLNENYARELMELHTLGVNGGYSQQDVQQMAHILTGVGINVGDAPRLRPQWQGLYLRRGAFEFNPARHDFGPRTLLGQRIGGEGFAEVENAVTLITRQRACAQFISHELAAYFVADDPPPQLVAAMAQTFQRSDGDIAAVLRTMFLSRDYTAALGGKFKDPMRYVLSAVRLAYDGRPISNAHPLLNWLNALGEAPFARQTPDGFPLTQLSWASPGQMSRRFEIARAIGSGAAGLFDPEDGSAASGGGFPQLSNRMYFEALEPFLGTSTRAALARANSPQEWNTFLLSSPDFNYE